MRKGICKHYNGKVFLDKGDCDAGINVRNLVGGDVPGWFTRCPCIDRHESEITCIAYKDPSDKEIEADEKQWEFVISNLTLARPLIRKLKAENPNGGSGSVECPACTGKFNYTISSYNNHMHAKCETEGCISFME